MDFLLHAITGKRLLSLTLPQPSNDTPDGKLQSTEQVRIQYAKPDPAGGSSFILCAAPNPLIEFGLKPTNHFEDTTFDVYTNLFQAPDDPTLPNAFYTASLAIDSVALRALFPVAADGTSPTQVALMGEIKSGGVPSDTFTFLAINNVIKGTESPLVAVPGPSGYPSSLVAVATNAAKLALIGIAAGYTVLITNEAARTEMYLGPVAGEAGAGLTVSGADGDEAGAYAFDDGGWMNAAGYNVAADGAGGWLLRDQTDDAIYQGSVAAFPWLAVWSPVSPGVPDVTVTRNDVATDANWSVIHNTINLTVQNLTGADAYFPQNSVTVPGDGSFCNAGWFDPAAIAISPNQYFQIGDVTDEFGTIYQFGQIYSWLFSPFCLPLPAAPRARLTIQLIPEFY